MIKIREYKEKSQSDPQSHYSERTMANDFDNRFFLHGCVCILLGVHVFVCGTRACRLSPGFLEWVQNGTHTLSPRVFSPRMYFPCRLGDFPPTTLLLFPK